MRGQLHLAGIKVAQLTTAEWLDCIYAMLVRESAGEANYHKAREAIGVELNKAAVQIAANMPDPEARAHWMEKARANWGLAPEQRARQARLEEMLAEGDA